MNTRLMTPRIAFSLALAALLLPVAPARAQDKATLDLLVKKNIITQDEAAGLAKSSAEPGIVAGPKDPNVKSLRIEGLIQSQFDWLSTSDKSTAAGAANPPAEEQFLLRRAYLGALIDMGNGWGGEIVFDFATGSKVAGGYQGVAPASITPQPNFEKIIVTRKLDDWNAVATAGYRKVNFTLEEYTPTTVIKPIERSILSNYFDGGYKGAKNQRIGFAARHDGLFWDGKISDTGVFYGLAVTNGIQSSTAYAPTGGLNRFGGWAYVGYNGTVGADLSYMTGLNYGYSQDGNSLATQANSVWGYNPYLRVNYGKGLQVDAEFIQAMITNGRGTGPAGATTQRVAPFGFNITPSYKISDQWELMARYTYLNTNGRGTNISDVVTNAPDVTSAGPLFDDAQSFYAGLNWNVMGDSVKILMGYEWDEFTHRETGAAITDSNLTGPRANVSGFRVRAQLQF